ncbi:amino acid ABC transporter ATP-binding/permease protein [Xylocopilactobacillus apicola]|uniref:Multidrug ABC transporter permease n=1 Tax=Xylocopilactobacillus apicola TaxID=2932184 RepID=A0AAU9DWZ4_9LACO|nr:ABC transporter ATP-binding protein [Xylocopilactobacillus apicola]BDR58593.1 multidrug ABC transporter permease [Xylocopilactobacillus apicola]
MIKRMISFVRPLIPALCLSLLTGLAAESLQVIVAWFTGIIITTHFSWPDLWFILIVIVIGGICAFVEQYSGHYVAFKILATIRKLVYRKIQKLAPAGLDQKQSGDLLKTIGSDIEAMEIFYAHTIVPLFLGLIFLVGVSIIFALIAPIAGLIYLICGILIGIGLPLFKANKIADKNSELSKVQGQIQQDMFEAIRGRDILIQLDAVSKKLAAVRSNYQEEAIVSQQVGLLNWQKGWLKLIILIISWIITAAGLISFNYPLATVLPLLLAFPFAFKPVEALASLSDSLSKGFGAAKRVFALLDTPEPKSQNSGTLQIEQIQDLKIQNLNFSYPNRDVEVLKDVSLTLKQGQIGGIIGPSGSGKSTLVKLIMEWYPVSEDTISLNGTELNKIDHNSLWSQINYLTQEPQLFSDSIRQNLTLGDETFCDSDLWNILSEVQLTDLVKQLPKGLDEPLEALDLELSAGEAQRLALARALLHPSSFLILDEPTSNLDVLNEKIILYAIKKHYQGMVLMITHREESLSICDVVWKISNGQVKISR